jgi:hypothetical protein
MSNLSNNPDKLSYVYLLTPTGVSEKTLLTWRFLQRKLDEFEKLRGKIEAPKLAVQEETSNKVGLKAS